MHITIDANSNTATGAVNVSSNGSSFEINFAEALTLPQDTKEAYVEVLGGSVWWSIPNISSTLGNNKIKITGPDTSDVTQTYTLTIPDGPSQSDRLPPSDIRCDAVRRYITPPATAGVLLERSSRSIRASSSNCLEAASTTISPWREMQ